MNHYIIIGLLAVVVIGTGIFAFSNDMINNSVDELYIEESTKKSTYTVNTVEKAGGIGGVATITHKDANGDIISIQEYHNRVVDQGEDFIIDQAFKEGSAGETADADQLASICVSAEVGFVDTSETKTAASFDTADALATTNCIADTAVTQTGQTAVIGPLTFTGGTHVPNDTTITGIGICQGSASTPFANCADAQAASSGILFSQINIVDVTLAASETVDITYTLDLSSSGS